MYRIKVRAEMAKRRYNKQDWADKELSDNDQYQYEFNKYYSVFGDVGRYSSFGGKKVRENEED